MVDRVSNISGEAAEMQEKLLSKAHDTLIKALEADLRVGIGMDGKLSAWQAWKNFSILGVLNTRNVGRIHGVRKTSGSLIFQGCRHQFWLGPWYDVC